MRVSNTNRRDSLLILNTHAVTVLRKKLSPSSVRRTFLLRKATAMDSFAFSILTDHALSGLRHYEFEREKFAVFNEAVIELFCLTVHRSMYGENLGYVSTSKRMNSFVGVVARLSRNFDWPYPPRNLTWADYADALGSAMVANNLVAPGDNFTLFKIVMFVKDLRSQLSSPVGVVRRRRRTLAAHFIEFIFADAAPPAGVVAHADEQVAVVEDGVADEQVAVVEDGVADEQVAVVEDGVADEQVAVVEDGVADEQVAVVEDGVADEQVAVVEDGVADEQVAVVEDGVADEQVAVVDDGVADEQVAVVEDGVADEQVAVVEDGVADEQVAVVEDGVADEQVAVVDDGVADEQVAVVEDGVADEQVAVVEDGVADEQVAVVDDGVVAHADEPEPAGVVAHADEPVVVVEDGVAAVDGDADEPVALDEDGDVVMETEELVSGSRGSKRRRSQALSYEREMSRVTGTRRRYNLRNTRAREERMVNLKEAEDSKRKADEAESSSKGSRKRSRR